jgi:hypothetical protein
MTDGPVDEGTQNARPAQAEHGQPDSSAPQPQMATAAAPGSQTSEETLKRWEASPG